MDSRSLRLSFVPVLRPGPVLSSRRYYSVSVCPYKTHECRSPTPYARTSVTLVLGLCAHFVLFVVSFAIIPGELLHHIWSLDLEPVIGTLSDQFDLIVITLW